MITFQCPQCNSLFKVQDELAGRNGKCKVCDAVIVVPRAVTAAKAKSLPDTITDLIDKWEVPSKAGTADGEDDAYQLQEGARNAAASRHCTSCGATMPPDGVLCVACGFDQTRGNRVKSAGAAHASAESKTQRCPRCGSSRIRAANDEEYQDFLERKGIAVGFGWPWKCDDCLRYIEPPATGGAFVLSITVSVFFVIVGIGLFFGALSMAGILAAAFGPKDMESAIRELLVAGRLMGIVLGMAGAGIAMIGGGFWSMFRNYLKFVGREDILYDPDSA